MSKEEALDYIFTIVLVLADVTNKFFERQLL
jgi:hypothetical protein